MESKMTKTVRKYKHKKRNTSKPQPPKTHGFLPQNKGNMGREIQANQKNFKVCKDRIIVHEMLNS
jgi:hypothetical protein